MHRDLKPQNVLVTSDGVVRICDFGLARHAVKTGGAITSQTAVHGTPYYMAPEQFAAEAVTAAADVWSFGGIIYYVITGRHPFSDKPNIPAVYGALALKQPPLLPMTDAQRSAIPKGLESVLRSCYAIEPTDRPTARTLSAQLQRLIETFKG